MVTNEKIYNAAWMRYRLGSVLIWLGVLVWAPFIILRIMGEQPTLFWYLPFHLVGVMGGSRLRAAARKEMGMPPPKKSRLRMLGHGLLFVSILVWVPYYYLKVAQQSVEVMDYLPFHLVGVLGGTVVLGISHFLERKSEVDVQEIPS
jgi:hypothetical protein